MQKTRIRQRQITSGNRAAGRNLIRGIAAALLVSCAWSAYSADIFVPGQVKREYYPNQTRASVAAGTAGEPATITYLPSFQMPTDFADNYAQRASTLFTPAVS